MILKSTLKLGKKTNTSNKRRGVSVFTILYIIVLLWAYVQIPPLLDLQCEFLADENRIQYPITLFISTIYTIFYMAGIYLHIPFCTTRCIYCDFYTVTSTNFDAFIEGIIKEISLRKNYLGTNTISTLYFGGGTPSVLSKEQLEPILEALYKTFSISNDAEITIEVNPDDVSASFVHTLSQLPFNRVSMGVQTFDDMQLRFLRRRHSAEQAEQAVKRFQDTGITNISIDLMYGLPHQTERLFESDLDKALNLGVPHISAYHLIYEQGTKLFRMLEHGEVLPAEEEESLKLFSLLISRLADSGFEHYEISNFAKENLYSQHNTAYWQQKEYLGLGPSAHSYNGDTRQWNVASLRSYLKALSDGRLDAQQESLSTDTKYNEFIMTGLRTMWGININQLEEMFGRERLIYCQKQARKYFASQDIVIQNNSSWVLSPKGKFISDTIMSDLMWV